MHQTIQRLNQEVTHVLSAVRKSGNEGFSVEADSSSDCREKETESNWHWGTCTPNQGDLSEVLRRENGSKVFG